MYMRPERYVMFATGMIDFEGNIMKIYGHSKK